MGCSVTRWYWERNKWLITDPFYTTIYEKFGFKNTNCVMYLVAWLCANHCRRLKHGQNLHSEKSYKNVAWTFGVNLRTLWRYINQFLTFNILKIILITILIKFALPITNNYGRYTVQNSGTPLAITANENDFLTLQTQRKWEHKPRMWTRHAACFTYWQQLHKTTYNDVSKMRLQTRNLTLPYRQLQS